jgi:omega-6 fatty acid desaturase (delta-12 desaturase)
VTTAQTTPAKPRSLRPVLDVIPAECYENPTWRGLFYLARDLLIYGLTITGLLLTDRIYFLVPLWLLAGLVVSALFVVGHDAAHQALFASKRLNGFVGRLAMLPSLHVFEAWVLGHNRVHHGHTVKAGFDFVWHPLTPEEFAALPRRKRLLHRIEWSPLGYGLYYGRQVWWNKMMHFTPPVRFARAIKRDTRVMKAITGTIAIGLLALGWAQYGSVLGAGWMLFKVALVPFALFCFMIGLIVHIHHIDRAIKWYHRPEWTKFAGQVEGTTILHAPLGLDFFLHWILEHSPHHVDMRIPMYHLKAAGQAIAENFPVTERKLRLRDIWANTRACKLYDFDNHVWLTYREAAALNAPPVA